MSGGGAFTIDLGLAQSVLNLFSKIDGDVNQYASQLFQAVNNLESDWNSPNKQSFLNDWATYCNAVVNIQTVGPRLVSGLTNEIALVQQAEGVQF